jgi:hypothetical protein
MTSSIAGKAVDGALRLVRIPADQLLRLVPGANATATAGLAIDRADATVRNVAGSLFRDQGLREDAELRREATEERKRAAQLRTEAEEKIESAEARTEKAQAESEARRKQADQKARRKQAQAAERRERLKEQAAETAAKRKRMARGNAQEAKEKAGKRGKVNRLEQLEKKSDALEVKEASVRAADEARRLEEAATATKEKRKGGSGGPA